MTETHNILLREGQTAIVCVDAPESAAPYYTIYNYDRFLPLLGLIAVFVLLLIAQNTGLNIRTLLFAGMMIASLGAVMDVAVSVLSALREVALASRKPERAGLFHSGINLGRV